MKFYGLGCLLFFGVIAFSPISAQRWEVLDERSIQETGKRDIIPTVYTSYRINAVDIQRILWTAPTEDQEISKSSTILTVGLPNGLSDQFRIVRYEMMEKELAEKFPQYRTFRGISESNPYRTIRADWTAEGFRAVIRDEKETIFIDPFQRGDLTHRIVYFKRDFQDKREWACGFNEHVIEKQQSDNNRLFGDCQFRTYRLAVATTGEYSNYFGAFNSSQSGLVLSQVITAVDRVNDVYEADFTVRLLLISNTSAVFYYDPPTDPFSGSACTQLSQNQTNMTAVIGNANYDLGHVFSVGSGGCASLSCVCVSSSKARGATGLNPPTGDPFYIDYVAHEMGHQLGGDHTFNGTAGSCNGNRVSASAYEPGSGTTIMAYAGICSSQNIQPHSDPYFHARSLQQITAVLNGASCANFLTLNNQAPIAGSPPNYTIPVSTPFVLTAIASDADNDPLTYCWEQYDLESVSSEPPSSTDTLGPLFRSLNPSTSPNRYFPNLSDLIQNVSSAWEVLPSVSRSMNFRMTVRDYHNGTAGCTDEDDVLLTVTNTSGPFLVTSQNISISWPQTSSQIITWNVANTTSAPVNCANVEIRLSTDGGFTYPTVLSANEPNDGMASIVVPSILTTSGRIMVKAVNNIFFDINNANISIVAPSPTFTISVNPPYVAQCNSGSVSTVVTIGQFMGYSNPVNLSMLNLPPGAIATFNPSSVSPGATSTLTITNLTNLSGTFSPTVRGTSNAIVKDLLFYFNLLIPPPISPTLSSPANNAINVSINPTLDWQAVGGATQYEYQVAFDIAFTSLATSGMVTQDQVFISSPLSMNQLYYWRVRANNNCGNGPWSASNNFTTGSCVSLFSTNVPVTISSQGTPIVYSTLVNNTGIVISDLDVINLMGTHSWMDDLKFSLISPQGTEVLFWNQPCDDHDNFNINFDDEAANNSWPCPPVNGLTYKPDGLLSTFDAQNALGTWTLKIQDVANQDGGVLNAWGLKVCGTVSCQLVVTQTSGSGTGSLPAAINCAMPGDTIKLSATLSGQTINIGSNPITISKNLVIITQGTNTTITGDGTRVFNINTGMQFECNGMTIRAGTSLTGGAISNAGTLKLKNMNVKKNPAISGATLVQNGPGGTVNVLGTCNINQ